MEKQELIKQIVEALKASGFEGTIIVSDDATGDTTVSATPHENIEEKNEQMLRAFLNSVSEGTIFVSDDAAGDTTVSATPQENIEEKNEPTDFDLSSVLAPLFEAAQVAQAAQAAQAAQIQGQALLKAQLEEELNELRCIDDVVSRAILEKEKIVADSQMMLSILARDKEAYYARANEIIEQLAYL